MHPYLPHRMPAAVPPRVARSHRIRDDKLPQEWIGQPIAREDVRWAEIGERAAKHRGDEHMIARTTAAHGDLSGLELADKLNRDRDRVLGSHGHLAFKLVLMPDVPDAGGH
jgi:hypothetical protein